MPPAAAARSRRRGGRNYTQLVGIVVAVPTPSTAPRPVYDPNLTARAGAHGRARALPNPRAVESNSPRSYTVAAAPFPSVFTARQNSSAPRRAIAYGVQRVRPCLRVSLCLCLCVCVCERESVCIYRVRECAGACVHRFSCDEKKNLIFSVTPTPRDRIFSSTAAVVRS